MLALRLQFGRPLADAAFVRDRTPPCRVGLPGPPNAASGLQLAEQSEHVVAVPPAWSVSADVVSSPSSESIDSRRSTETAFNARLRRGRDIVRARRGDRDADELEISAEASPLIAPTHHSQSSLPNPSGAGTTPTASTRVQYELVLDPVPHRRSSALARPIALRLTQCSGANSPAVATPEGWSWPGSPRRVASLCFTRMRTYVRAGLPLHHHGTRS